MSESVIVITPDTPLEKVVNLMLNHKIKKLLVIEKIYDTYKLSGILSLIGVARILSDIINSLKQRAQVETESKGTAFYLC